MPIKPHPTDPDKMVYVKREYNLFKEWVGLTDEEIVVRANAEVFAEAFARGVAWAEQKLKEKNT